MRVCLVSIEFAPFLGWGAGTYASLMSAAWAAAGHEVHVVTGHAETVARGPALRPGVTFHRVDATGGDAALPGYPCGHMPHSMAVRAALKALHAASPLDYIEFPDVGAEGHASIVAKRTTGDFDGAVLGVRLHMTNQYIRSINGEPWEDRWFGVLRAMEAQAIAGADVLVAPCRAMLDVVRREIEGAAGRPGFVVPYAFDAGRLAELGVTGVMGAGTSAGAGGGGDATPEVLYFGRLERRKGVHVLVEAALGLLRSGVDARFRFIGSDTPTGPGGRSMLGWLLARIEPALRGRFVFEARQAPRGEIGPAVARATVCCFPSVWENFPFACIEAMALGAAVVGSDGGGMAEMMEDGVSGVLFKAEDAGALEGALRRVLGDAGLRARLRAGAPGRIAAVCEPRRVAEMMERVVAEATPRARVVRVAEARRGSADVSVIIPVFDTHKDLREAVASVRGQTVGVGEIILIDDGSTDGAAVREMEALAAEGCVLLREPHRGVSAARNAGLRAARGALVLPLDSDDALEPAFVERCLGAMALDPGLAFVTSLMRCFLDGDAAAESVYAPVGPDRTLLPVVNLAGPVTGVFDKAAVLACGGYDEELDAYEDWDLYCALAERGLRGAVIPELLIRNRIRGASAMRTLGGRRHELLRARINEKHPRLATRPDVSIRLMAGEHARPEDETPRGAPMDPHAEARRIVAGALRYRLADRLNGALKGTPLHGVLKRVFGG